MRFFHDLIAEQEVGLGLEIKNLRRRAEPGQGNGHAGSRGRQRPSVFVKVKAQLRRHPFFEDGHFHPEPIPGKKFSSLRPPAGLIPGIFPGDSPFFLMTMKAMLIRVSLRRFL